MVYTSQAGPISGPKRNDVSERPPAVRWGPRGKTCRALRSGSPGGALGTCEEVPLRRVPVDTVTLAVPQTRAGPPLADKRRDETRTVATKAIVGEKVGMTQVWDDQHRAVPVTVVRVAPMRVVRVKTPEHEGYSALQVTWGVRRAATLNKPEQGHFDTAGVEPGRRLVELRIDDASGYEVGQELDGRRPGRRRAGRRDRRLQGQGLRRRHEAPQLQGPGRLPRQPQEAPVARARSAPAPPRPGSSRARRWPAGWVATR